MTMMSVDFRQRVDGFLAAANAKRRAVYPYADAAKLPDLQVMEGQRYLRVVNVDHGRCCYCFIDKSNGDVLKSGGWKAPAKHARSNIFAADFGVSGVGLYGANYLK